MQRQRSRAASLPQPTSSPNTSTTPRRVSRRRVLATSGVAATAGAAASTLGLLEALSVAPIRAALAATPAKSDVQYDIGAFVPPPLVFRGIPFGLGGPSHTRFLTARLNRMPTKHDQQVLAAALAKIESSYAWSPSGVFTFVAYGLPYFHRLPAALVAAHMPRLRSNTSRWALEEAVPTPTDIVNGVDPLHRPRFGGSAFSVRIEHNDVLISLRSDLIGNIADVMHWLQGSGRLNGQAVASPAFAGLFSWTSARDMFVQIGLPRRLADAAGLPFSSHINPDSPMWFGMADQNVNGAGPAAITTFQGNASARETSFPDSGHYFLNGTIQVLNHNIDDLQSWYMDSANAAFSTQLQLMFRATHPFGNGGSSPFWANEFFGTGDAAQGAQGIGTAQGVKRIGHLTALQRHSRAADGTPMHARMDGPGFDTMDTAGNHLSGKRVAKLQFSAFVPSADFFRRMRSGTAALDLVTKYGVDPHNNGVERFITATRRQNFLMPPRRHRAFPLVELT